MVQVELKVFNSGWVPAKRGMVLRGGGGQKLVMPALFALVRRPQQGVILYDTGYSTRFFEATRNFPYRVMRWITPAELTENGNADRQLERTGVKAGEVKTIILGHGHVDHVPGVSYFPGAELVVSRREWEAMQGPALLLFTRAYLKSLYQGLGNKLRFIDFDKEGKPLEGFDLGVDLFEDGSLVLVPLPGHTAGQMGLIVNSTAGRFFFIGDAAWVSENFENLAPPSRLASLILADPKQFLVTLQKIRDFHLKNPDVIIVPSHCPRAWEKIRPSVGS